MSTNNHDRSCIASKYFNDIRVNDPLSSQVLKTESQPPSSLGTESGTEFVNFPILEQEWDVMHPQ